MPLSVSLRNAEDWRSARTARRYMIHTVLTPNATVTAGTNILGITKSSATNPDVYISRIRLHIFQSAASVAAPIGWKRATTVAGGTLITLSDVPTPDSGSVVATMEARHAATVAVTGTKANQYILTHPAVVSVTAVTGGGIVDEWNARDLSERIRLTGTEGLILDWQAAGDADTRFHLQLVWEEVS